MDDAGHHPWWAGKSRSCRHPQQLQGQFGTPLPGDCRPSFGLVKNTNGEVTRTSPLGQYKNIIIYYKYFKLQLPSYLLPQKYTKQPTAYLICVDALIGIEIINNRIQLIVIPMEHQQQQRQPKGQKEEEQGKAMKLEEGQKIGQQKSTQENAMLSEETIPHANPKTEQAYLKPKATEQFDSFDEQHGELAAMFPSDPWQLDHPNINSQTIKTSQLQANLPIPQWMHSDDILKHHIPNLYTPKK